MRRLVVYIFFIALTVSLYAQSYISLEHEKAVLIWDIQKYLAWENDANLDRIVLGTYQCPKPMLEELEKTKPNRFMTGIDYYVINYQTIDDIKNYCRNCQMFYIPSDHNDKVREIMSILDPYPTLVITDGWYDKSRIMINLFVESSGEDVSFEYNKQNMINHGISILYKKEFEDLDGIDINMKTLLKHMSHKLDSVRDELQARQQELDQKLQEIERQKQKIQQQNKFIREQEQIIAQRQAEISAQKAKLQQLYSELMTYQQQLQKQIEELHQKELEIEASKKQLSEYKSKVKQQQQKYYEQAKLLEEQHKRMKEIEREVQAKKKELERLNWQVNAQRLVIAVFFILLVIIGILSYFIYKSYKIQKQQNIILNQQKEQIQAQAEQLEKLSIVASETSNAVAILLTDGTFEWVNAGFIKLYGFTLQMLRNNFDANVANFNPQLARSIEVCMRERTSITTESKITTRDGRTVWIQTTITPIIDDQGNITKVILIDSDITKIKEAEEEIRRKNEQIMRQAKELERKNFELAKLSIVAEKTDNGVIIADKTGEIEWVNPGFERMLGMTYEEFRQHFGNNIIFTDLDARTLEDIERALRKRESAEFTYKLSTPKHKLLWLRSTLTPMFNDKGELLKIFSINADITEIKLAQEKIEKQNRDITKSIQYAQRIQQAALTPKEFIDSLLPENFILYMPRDIVSGDFYWVTQVRDKILFTAADCTGHGVPGAFMSMLGIAFLNEIVGKLDYEELQPNIILNTLREYVIRFLKQEDSPHSSKDGMDMSFCVYDTTTDELYFAGANNPLWIVRDGSLIELPPDDMPIGIYYNSNESFTNHMIKVERGDMLYLFSDGYADQFGGPRGKKFMVKRFRQLILEISPLPLDIQQELLLKRHLEWKGDRKQLDDILVMGVRL